MRPKTLRILLCVFLAVSVVRAEPEGERQKLAVELVELLAVRVPHDDDFKKALDRELDGVIPLLNLGEEDSKRFRRAAMEVAEGITTERMVGFVAAAYAKRLSAAELREIIAFHRSDAGKAWLRHQSSIETGKKEEMKAAMATVIEEIRERFVELEREDPE